MNIEEFREYCLSKNGAFEDTPFGPETLVFKVAGKIFAITGLENSDFRISLKCEPDYAVELREKYEFIIPGYHLNKRHWNTILMGNIGNLLAKSLIDHSYDQVVSGLSKKERVTILQ